MIGGFLLTRHAASELVRRSIPERLLAEVLLNPQQIVPAHGGCKAYQSKTDFGEGKIFLLRAIVDDRVDPMRVITVYRTSKVEKYWSKP